MKKSIKLVLFILLVILSAFISIVIVSACDDTGNLLNDEMDNSELTHVHSYEDWTVTNSATCTTSGERESYCLCGDKQVEIIDPLGHDYILHEGQSATCTQSGFKPYRTCTRCDYTTYAEIPATGHDYGEWTIITQATCFENGEGKRVCSHNESHVETKSIDKLNHNESDWISIIPSCEADGLNYKECNFCHTVLQSEIIPALGHDYGAWTVMKESTCSTEGEETRFCSRDNSHSQTRSIAVIAHTLSDWITDVAPTCETDGLKYKKCSECRTMLEHEVIKAVGHNYGAWNTSVEATCTTEGEEIRFCLNDENHFQTRITDAKAHTESDWITIIPSCEVDGLRYKECNSCYTVLQSEIIPALNHDFGEWVLTVAPICVDVGVEIRVCSRDDSHTETRTVEATGHSAKWSYDDEKHYLICENCSEQLESSFHEWDGNECESCGYSKVETEGLKYVSNGDDSYTVKGLGAITENNIVIPETYNGKPVTEIASYAFRDCTNLISITISKNVKTIGEGAFYGCNNLESITLPFIGLSYDGKEYKHFGIIFGAETPEENSKYVPETLNTVIISGDISEIAPYSFKGCGSLKSVILPDFLEIIGEGAFSTCTGLNSIIIPRSVKEIGSYAFYGSGVTEVVFENTEGWATYDNDKQINVVSNEVINNVKYSAIFLTDNNYCKYVWKCE